MRAIGIPHPQTTRVRDFRKKRADSSERSRSVHPAAFAAAVLLGFVIGWTEVSVLVKIIFGVLVVLLHVDLEFPAGSAALPAMVAISERGRLDAEERQHICAPPHHSVPEKPGGKPKQLGQEKKAKASEDEICCLNATD